MTSLLPKTWRVVVSDGTLTYPDEPDATIPARTYLVGYDSDPGDSDRVVLHAEMLLGNGEHEAPDSSRAMADAIVALLSDGTDEEFEHVAFYGGDHPDGGAGYDSFGMDLAAAEEHAQWLVESGVARRRVHYGPWEVLPVPAGDEAAEASV